MSDVSTLQTMFQSGQTRPESTERERETSRERERDKQRGELTEGVAQIKNRGE